MKVIARSTDENLYAKMDEYANACNEDYVSMLKKLRIKYLPESLRSLIPSDLMITTGRNMDCCWLDVPITPPDPIELRKMLSGISFVKKRLGSDMKYKEKLVAGLKGWLDNQQISYSNIEVIE